MGNRPASAFKDGDGLEWAPGGGGENRGWGGARLFRLQVSGQSDGRL